MDPELMNEIKLKAYEMYEKSGCTEGRDLKNWLEAERLVLAQRVEKPEEAEREAGQAKSESCAACVIW